MSILTIPLPTNNCKIIEAVTIGPIPRDIMLPKSVPSMTAKYSNLESEFDASPKREIFARTKKAISTIKVHFNFTLKLNFFSTGGLTSGRFCNRFFNSILLFFFSLLYF